MFDRTILSSTDFQKNIEYFQKLKNKIVGTLALHNVSPEDFER
jgi:hypothetical protein